MNPLETALLEDFAGGGRRFRIREGCACDQERILPLVRCRNSDPQPCQPRWRRAGAPFDFWGLARSGWLRRAVTMAALCEQATSRKPGPAGINRWPVSGTMPLAAGPCGTGDEVARSVEGHGGSAHQSTRPEPGAPLIKLRTIHPETEMARAVLMLS